MTATGVVHLVGAGPGNPDLLTLKAARLLGEARVVVCDRRVGDGIRDLIPVGASRIGAGKARGSIASVRGRSMPCWLPVPESEAEDVPVYARHR